MALDRHPDDAVRAFTAGGLVALVLALVLPSALQTARGVLPIPSALASLVWGLPIPLSMAVGGLIAGGALGRGLRGTVAIGMAMLIASAILVTILGDAGRLTGRESPTLVIALELGAGIGAFALGGACAGRLMCTRPGELCKVTAGFAGGGLLVGVASVVTFLLARVGASAVLGRAYPIVLLLCQTLNILGPFAVSGAVLGRVLGNRPD